MQWTNISTRKALCKTVYKKVTNYYKVSEMREIFLRYSIKDWEKALHTKKEDHFHGLGCHFLQSSIGLDFILKFKSFNWVFDSWVEYKVNPLKIKELPCRCIWNQRGCHLIKNNDAITVLRKICPFLAKMPRRLDLCWIEKSLLDQIAVTAEVELRSNVKQDLGKVHSIFIKSTNRGKRGFDDPILHIQMDLSGKSKIEEIVSFMKNHWSRYILSPSIIYITHNDFNKWFFTYLYRGKIIKSKSI